jgi:hypothetical protein
LFVGRREFSKGISSNVFVKKSSEGQKKKPTLPWEKRLAFSNWKILYRWRMETYFRTAAG